MQSSAKKIAEKRIIWSFEGSDKKLKSDIVMDGKPVVGYEGRIKN